MQVNDYIDGLISDFLADGISKEDSLLLKKWIAASPENKKHFEAMQEAWIAAGNFSSHYDSYAAFEKFKVRKAKHLNARRTYLLIAASISAIFLSTFLGFHTGKNNIINTMADIEIETPVGTRTRIWLPDSTSIWLNSSSKIRYSQNYGIKDRVVALEGEGLFEVRHDSQKPFTVASYGISVTDIGTRFDFKNYESDSQATISVLDGSISLSGGKAKNMIMNVNETVIIDKESGKFKLIKDKEPITEDWTTGRLTFSDNLMSEIAKDLERAYGVKIIFEDPEVADIRFNGSFVFKGEPLNSVMDDFAGTGKLFYEISQDTVRISKGNL